MSLLAAVGESRPMHIQQATPISHQFQRSMDAAAETVPSAVWNRLAEAGWQVKLAEFVVDVDPTLAGVRPRGWPANSTWENADAVHLPQRKLLVFAEKRRNRRGTIELSRRMPGVLRHEIGHAWDMAPGFGQMLSSSSAFVQAYHRDVRQLDSRQRGKFQYYLQAGAAGRQELFAEVFALQCGGGSDERYGSEIIGAFPSVARIVSATYRKKSSETLLLSGSKKPQSSRANR